MDSENIALSYQEQLDKLTGEKLITVRTIRDGTSLCFNTNIREIVETLEEMNKGVLSYTEKYFFGVIATFAIEIKLLTLENTTLNFDKDEFLSIYKTKFQNRVRKITNKYDNVQLNSDFTELYNSIKAEYNKLVNSDNINIQEYISIRNKFDDFREQYKNQNN